MQSVNNPYPHLDDGVYASIANGTYKKSQRSNGTPGGCVMVAVGPEGLIGLQDSKLSGETRKERTHVFTPTEMRAFILGVKDGEFDYLVDL